MAKKSSIKKNEARRKLAAKHRNKRERLKAAALDESRPPEDRMAVARKLGNFRTSMLQDVEHGRPIELVPILGAVVELGRRIGAPHDSLSAVYGLTRLAARMKGLYPADTSTRS